MNSDDPFVRALRTAVGNAPDCYAGRPRQLQARLTAAFGPDAVANAPGIHLLAVAADENVPRDLQTAAPVGDAELVHLAADLAASRGWNPAAARWSVLTWARALDTLAPGAGNTAGQAAADGTERTSTGGTILPEREDDPMKTVVPVVSPMPDRRGPRSLGTHRSHSGGRPDDGASRALPAWPAGKAAMADQASRTENSTPGGVFVTFRGERMMTALTDRGYLVVDDAGLRWYQQLGAGERPDVVALWADVSVTLGRWPRLHTPDGVLWLGARGQALAQAAQSRVDASRRVDRGPREQDW